MTGTMKLIAGILTVAAFVTLCYKVDFRWVKTTVHAKDISNIHDKLAFMDKRLEQKILYDERSNKQQRVWELEKHYKSTPDPVDYQEILELKQEIKDIDRQLGKPVE